MILLVLIYYCLSFENFDLYKSLNLNYDASLHEIDLSYSKFKRRFNSLSYKNPEGYSFEEITFAYNILIDTDLRRVYDLFGFNKLNERLQNNKLNTTSNHPAFKKLKSLQSKISLSITEFYLGCSTEIIFHRREICRCIDKGYFCEKCRGKPTIIKPFSILLEIPAGTLPNQIFMYDNVTDITEYSFSGTIELMVLEKPDKIYKRDGYNLITNIFITKDEKKYGFNRFIELPDGNAVRLNQKKFKGNEIVIKNKGFPIPNKPNERGDFIIIPLIKNNEEI